MSDFIETWAGIPAQLALTATDGRADLYPRATVFNGNASPIPVGAVNLEHRMLGFYRASIALPGPGIYRAVYRNFLDPARTTVDRDREQDQDTIIVRPLDTPLLGVAYDQKIDTLFVEVSVGRNGQPMPASELLEAQVTVYDADDHAMWTIEDLLPDGRGVYRLTRTSPGLTAERLYHVHVRIQTQGAGTVEANKGFYASE